MKHKIFILAFLALITAFGVLSAFDKASDPATEMGVKALSNIYQYTWTTDTITNAANDTLTLPASLSPMYGDFIWCYSVVRTNISGTTNLAVKVEESNLASGNTNWIQADVTAATTATSENLTGDHVYGIRHRVIVDGTGTQSSSYSIKVTLKRKT